MATVKLSAVGNGLGVELPLEMLHKLGVSKGCFLKVIETIGGIELRPYDSDENEQIAAAEQVMHEDRDVLGRLGQ